jgi:hypothetical protein
VDVNIERSFIAFLAAKNLHEVMTGKKAKELWGRNEETKLEI